MLSSENSQIFLSTEGSQANLHVFKLILTAVHFFSITNIPNEFKVTVVFG